MPIVVGISFKQAGKVYYFDPAGLDLHEGNFVIAETARGIEFGEVQIDPKEVTDDEIVSPLKKIVRKATPADMSREEMNKNKEKQAFTTCQQKIQTHNLPMKLIDAEYCFDGTQVTFYFSAESRVDFRELVKDLAGALRTKVQLHQVGVRDEAKLFGGLGPCGRPLCCATFLSGFEPVSMKMAKEQSLFLNPLKFSGICGKLMCCLKYEYQIYKDSRECLPAVGSIVQTEKGPGRVVEVNVLKEALSVQYDDGTIVTYPAANAAKKAACPAQNGGQCEGCSQKATEIPTEDIILRLPVKPEVNVEEKHPKSIRVAMDGEPESGATANEKKIKRKRPKRNGKHRPRRPNNHQSDDMEQDTDIDVDVDLE